MAYKHGIEVQENPTSLAVPVNGTAGLQVVFGTAPINLVEDPYKATNEPVLVYELSEAQKYLGYSEDIESYTLCQSMDACFRIFKIAPVIFINVLDPERHKKTIAETTVNVVEGQAVVEKEGILLDKLIVKSEEGTLEAEEDYITSFNSQGFAVITLLEGDHTELKVTGTAIDPTAVKAIDIIGGYDSATGKETGLELVRKIYPKFGLTPGLLLAPGWSHIPEVGAVIATKSTEINGVFRCENILDLDTEKATKYTDCLELKNQNGYTDKHSVLVWPMIQFGGKSYYYSAIYAALTAYTDAQNGDIPYLSPSNKLLGISGTVLKDGTEINLDQNQAATLNGQGIVTAINEGGWKSWGNNTACYPANTDPKDRWLCCRRFFSWWGNSFILTYKNRVDNPANAPLIEAIVDSENIRGNSYVSQGICAGARMEFIQAENPVTDLLNGKIQFKQYLAPYVPAEYILNVLEFDPTMLEEALGGI